MKLLLVTSLLLVTCYLGDTNDIEDIQSIINELDYLDQIEKKEHETDTAADMDEESVRLDLCDAYVQFELDTSNIKDDEFSKSVQDDLKAWNECLRRWTSKEAYAGWNYSTNITNDNAEKLKTVTVQSSRWSKAMGKNARKYLDDDRHKSLPEDAMRQVRLLAQTSTPSNDEDVEKLQTTLDDLQAIYSSAKVSNMKLEPDLTKIMAESRDPAYLKKIWVDWRDATGPGMRSHYTQLVELLNLGARDNGYSDYGEAWRDDQFDQTPDLEAMCDRLWRELEPIYRLLHTYVRRKLTQFYGPEVVGRQQGIPAHLLGNMWAQDWRNIYDIVDPFPQTRSPDYNQEMINQKYDVEHMFSLAEGFYKSLGFPAMTDKFNQYSMKVRPPDREVTCHASAEDFYTDGDFRIKMCTEVNMEYFSTIHHEMGHIEYFMAYQELPAVYRTGANSGFHEAVGDTVSLSVETRKHLQTIKLARRGLEQKEDELEKELFGVDKSWKPAKKPAVDPGVIQYLLQKAMFKLAFVPFGYLVDKWRWEVFRGNIQPRDYNKAWWKLRSEIQGIVPPVERSESDFDPGAKFHMPSNSPYMCYFVSFIVQFQFYERLCELSHHDGDLFDCDFYDNKEAGAAFWSMLELGKSKPWPDALEAFTGTREISTSSIRKYFKPLISWLEDENEKAEKNSKYVVD